MKLFRDEFDTPIGTVYVVTDGTAVRAVDFSGYEQRMQRLLARHCGEFEVHAAHTSSGFTARLKAYFDGDLDAILGIPTATNGTPFQKAVWTALHTIPVGSTATYQEIATRIGKPKACRAVGLANGANPVSVIVPCHRVIGANDRLTGYGGGLDRKKWLLEHERR